MTLDALIALTALNETVVQLNAELGSIVTGISTFTGSALTLVH
jgi:hypothetical protein